MTAHHTVESFRDCLMEPQFLLALARGIMDAPLRPNTLAPAGREAEGKAEFPDLERVAASAFIRKRAEVLLQHLDDLKVDAVKSYEFPIAASCRDAVEKMKRGLILNDKERASAAKVATEVPGALAEALRQTLEAENAALRAEVEELTVNSERMRRYIEVSAAFDHAREALRDKSGDLTAEESRKRREAVSAAFRARNALKRATTSRGRRRARRALAAALESEKRWNDFAHDKRSRAKPLTCIFCNTPHASLADLKEHSATCGEHPAVRENQKLHAVVAKWASAWDELNEQVGSKKIPCPCCDATGCTGRDYFGEASTCYPCHGAGWFTVEEFKKALEDREDLKAALQVSEFEKEQQLAAHRWIPCDARMPGEEDGTGNDYRVLWLSESKNVEFLPHWWGAGRNYTHWMPIPALPTAPEPVPDDGSPEDRR